MIVQLSSLPHQTTHLGISAHQLMRKEIELVLVTNGDLFVWSPADMSSIDLDFICHKLAPYPDQTCSLEEEEARRGMAWCSRARGVVANPCQIHQGGCVYYLSSKVIMVKKSGNKQRMCVDYTNLNKVFPTYYRLSIGSLTPYLGTSA